jgi:hypothetical protein
MMIIDELNASVALFPKISNGFFTITSAVFFIAGPYKTIPIS